MKILLLAQSFPPPSGAGSVQYIANIFAALPAGSTLVITSNTRPAEARVFDASFPQKVVRLPFVPHVTDGIRASRAVRAVRYFLWPLAVLWTILRERPQIVHISEYNSACSLIVPLKRLFGIPFVLFTYAEEITYITTQPLHLHLLRSFLRSADAIVTVSDFTARILEELGADCSRIHKILPAVGCGKLSAKPEDMEALRTKCSLHNVHVLLTVGRLIERKGHATVIEAMPAILQSIPTVRYVIVGTGPEEAKLRELVNRAGLDGYVRFQGETSDDELACWYEICDVFVMPHRELEETRDTEGCPTVFLEASAHGKPVIGGRDGGVADAILHNKTGLIIDGRDAARLAKGVCDLIKNPELAASMGAAGRDYAATLGAESRAAILEKINDEILRGTGVVAKPTS